MEKRDSRGRFTKGSVGNPKGRPKKKPTAEQLLEGATMVAVVRLLDLVNSEDDAVALKASIEILDRVLGTPEEITPIDSRHLSLPSVEELTNSYY